MVRLKAIASSSDRCGSSRWRSTKPPKQRKPPARATVPSSTRLDCSVDLGAALEGAYLFGRPGCHPVFLVSGVQWAGRGCVPGPTRRGSGGPTDDVDDRAVAALRHPRQAGVGRRSRAGSRTQNEEVVAYPETWPVTALATELGICGQIDRNPQVIRGDLATDRGAEISGKPCSDAVMRGRRPPSS